MTMQVPLPDDIYLYDDEAQFILCQSIASFEMRRQAERAVFRANGLCLDSWGGDNRVTFPNSTDNTTVGIIYLNPLFDPGYLRDALRNLLGS